MIPDYLKVRLVYKKYNFDLQENHAKGKKKENKRIATKKKGKKYEIPQGADTHLYKQIVY